MTRLRHDAAPNANRVESEMVEIEEEPTMMEDATTRCKLKAT